MLHSSVRAYLHYIQYVKPKCALYMFASVMILPFSSPRSEDYIGEWCDGTRTMTTHACMHVMMTYGGWGEEK